MTRRSPLAISWHQSSSSPHSPRSPPLGGARRTQQELTRQLEEKGLALGGARDLEPERHRRNALMEQMITATLDNARMVDQVLLPRADTAVAQADQRRQRSRARGSARPRGPPVRAACAASMVRMMGGDDGSSPGARCPDDVHVGARWARCGEVRRRSATGSSGRAPSWRRRRGPKLPGDHRRPRRRQFRAELQTGDRRPAPGRGARPPARHRVGRGPDED